MTLRSLIVDDNAGYLAAARALLEREGETVYEIGVIERGSGEPDAVIA
ncbi:MAG TPA: hypothetical protein VFC77_04840 [Myxococcota bacterium]|nr:hypothetical protein [Myxococcota bacterium]